ncbi:hypothetical protein EDC96DRAFT_493188 [Choanephora cucurbitarum]|nr:hypothetical protein EDC96DRAFT_493188 [Choanephora cucurbitarum]
MTEHSQIFKATYSGVPVYEMICKGVAVMRRKSDSYLNATQILKVADFDKPQRTRILEREVQIGQHEKVQGGYGKYQGTWVPFERGKALAELYGVDKILAPILEFIKGDQSPPLAPKHATAASVKPRKPREVRVRKRTKHFDEEMSDVETSSSQNATAHNQSHDDLSPLSKRVRTRPSALREKTKLKTSQRIDPDDGNVSEDERDNDIETDTERQQEEQQELDDEFKREEMDEMSEKTYAQRLLQYFLSEKTSIPPLIARPPRDMDINVIIDDEGHTSLHWAAAMARIKAVKLLIENGADMYRVNYKGQTALMRSVLFTNNFDLKTFDSLVELLRTTIFNIDKRDQTVFHHTAAMSDWKGKIYASRYYMECLINKLKNNQSELISILNVQDINGDTALTIAAKIGNRRLIKLLIDAGASTEIANEEGMTPRDYYADMEKSVGRHPMHPSPPPMTSSPSEDTGSIINEADTREVLRARVEAMYKNVTADANANNMPSISKAFDDFAESYERDLVYREKQLEKKQIELDLYTKRLEETKRVIRSIETNEAQALIEQADNKNKQLEDKYRVWLQFYQSHHLSLLEDEFVQKEQEEKPPSPPQQATADELKALKDQLIQLKVKRKESTQKLFDLQCRVPPKKYQDYKRLISTCCNVAYENVDLMLGPLLASFEQEQNVSSPPAI